MAIKILSSENITGNITLHSPTNAPYIDFVENADTSDSKARITMDQVDTNNGKLFISTENSGTLTNAVVIDNSQNVGIGNFTNPSDGNLVVKKDGLNTGIPNSLTSVSFSESGGQLKGLTIGYRTDETTAVIASRTATGDIAFMGYDGGWLETARFTNDNRLGIGTPSPAFPLEVENSSTAYLFSQTTGSSASSGYRWKTPNSEFAWFSTGGTNAMALYDYVASAERMRIDSSGNVKVGRPSGYGNSRIQSFIASTSNFATSNFLAADSTNMAAGVGGEITFVGKYATGVDDYAFYGGIKGFKENATSGNTACALGFYTRATGTLPTERMRITSSGLTIFKSSFVAATAYGGELNIGGSSVTTFGLQAKYNQGGATQSTLYSSPGYTSNDQLFLLGAGAGNTAQLVLRGNGNVGIGTTSPGATLDVNGATYVRNVIYGYAGSGNQYGGLSWGGTDEGFLFLKDSNVTKVVINSNDNSYFNGGNVGIGTTSPGSKLELYGDTSSGGYGVYPALTIRNDNTSGFSAVHFNQSTNQKARIEVSNSGGSMGLYTTSAASGILINSAGHVGIGTTSPDRSLDVEGNGMAIFGTGGYTELMLRGQVEGTSTVRNVGAFHWSIRADIGGDNDDLKLARFVTGSFVGIAMQVENSTGDIFFGNTVVNPASGFSNQRGFGYDNSTGNVQIAATSGNALTVGRNESSDGAIMTLRKESNVKHSFGSTTSYLLTDVGIGTTSTGTYKLNVVGTALFSGFVEMAGGGAVYQGQKFYLDGGGDSYMESPSSNVMHFYTNGIQRARITDGGNFIIGTETSTACTLKVSSTKTGSESSPHFCLTGNGYSALHWLDTVAYYILSNSTGRQIRIIANSGGVKLTVNATAWQSNSDIALKENLKPLENVLDKVKDYRCVEYNLKESPEDKKIGFIAQDWENDFPAIVDKDENDMLGMKYTETIPVLLKAIQELKSEIDLLKNK